MEPKNSSCIIPVSAPLYAEPPYLYRSSNSLICIFRAEVLKAIYCELDFDLPYGEVAHEYRENL